MSSANSLDTSSPALSVWSAPTMRVIVPDVELALPLIVATKRRTSLGASDFVTMWNTNLNREWSSTSTSE
eukprot:91500-Prymnesium_polylepis.1